MPKIVSVFYRLPVTLTRAEESDNENNEKKYTFKRTDGGIITFVEGVKDHVKNVISMGWPGMYLDESSLSERQEVTNSLTNLKCVPVFIDKANEIDYLSFCNRTMWPVIHKFVDKCYYREVFWGSFQQVCRLFAEKCAELVENGDLILINGINMMMVAFFLKDLVKVYNKH
jgi:trehalose-6-phosphate synthase